MDPHNMFPENTSEKQNFLGEQPNG